jgi:PAS domain S-box-containing protein
MTLLLAPASGLIQAAALARLAYWSFDGNSGQGIASAGLLSRLGEPSRESGSEFSLEHLNTRIHPQDAAIWQDWINALMSGAAVQGGALLSVNAVPPVIRLRQLLGGWLWFKPKASLEVTSEDAPGDRPEGLLPIAAGKSGRSLTILFEDYTDQRSLEAALRDSQMRYRSLYELAPVAVIVTERSGIITEWNLQATSIFGWSRQEALGQSLIDLLLPKTQRAEFVVRLKEALRRDGRTLGLLQTCHTQSGSDAVCQWQSARLTSNSGRVFGLLTLIQDVTEAHNAAIGVQRSEALYRTLVETTPDAILLVEADGRIQVANQQAARLFASDSLSTVGELYERTAGELFPDPVWKNFMAETVSEAENLAGFINSREFSVQRSDGQVLALQVFFTGLCGLHSEDTEVTVLFIRDVSEARRAEGELLTYRNYLENLVHERTQALELQNAQLAVEIQERLRAETALREAKDLAESAALAKGSFLANMSHEIRTPMNAILGLAHLLSKTASDAQQRDYLKRIIDAGGLLLGLLNDVLDLSKIEAGRMTVEKLAFRLDDVLVNASSMVLHRVQEKGLDLQVSIAAGVPSDLIGDPLRLSQILVNLLSNAAKFTETGYISVFVRSAQSSSDTLTLTIDVQDSGIGLTPEQASKLFAAFTQADDTTTRRFGGTGLGLAICKKLVEAMDGSICLHSEPGQGSTFSFSVRLGFDVASPPTPARALPWLAGANDLALTDKPASVSLTFADCRVILADDVENNQLIAVELLKGMGLRVDVADNGQQVLDLLNSGVCYDAVLMDVQMPEMDGLEATRRLRMNPHFAGLPVIALTANAASEEQDRCRQAGMNDFLSKPFTPLALSSVLARWLSSRHLAVEASPKSATAAIVAAETPLAVNMPDLPGIDTCAGLPFMNHKVAFYEKMLKAFPARFGSVAEAIRIALASGNWEQAEQTAHSLKGVAGSIGATRLQQAANRIDDALRCRDGACRNEFRNELNQITEFDELDAALSEVLSGIRAHYGD